jgi:hypothetical protein
MLTKQPHSKQNNQARNGRMLTYKKRLSILFVMLVITLETAVVSLRSQSENSSNLTNQEKVDPTHYPLTDFDSPEPVEPNKRNLQRARSRQHDIGDKNIKTQNLRNFALKETDPPELFQLIPSDAPEEPALPISQSDAIAIGQVTNAEAHLSNDKTNVYSEFLVRVEDVFKSDRFGSLSFGGLISLTRSGGRVRFPSGKTLLRGSYGRGMPRAERRYLFFLKYNDEGQNYPIITAYELRNGHVFPLDWSRKGGTETSYFGASSYESAQEASFIGELKAAIEKARIH